MHGACGEEMVGAGGKVLQRLSTHQNWWRISMSPVEGQITDIGFLGDWKEPSSIELSVKEK